jgi:hypothetical protein
LGAPEQHERIVEMMMQHAAAAEGEEVDAANLAMILRSLRRRRDGEQSRQGVKDIVAACREQLNQG